MKLTPCHLEGEKSKGSVSQVQLTGYLNPGNSLEYCTEFNQAKEREITRLEDNNIYEVEFKEDVPVGSNIRGGGFLLCLRSKDKSEED